MSGETIAVVPVKRLAAAKSRLAGTLTARERADLVLACFDRVIRALQECDEVRRFLVVTAEPRIRDRALGAGAEIVDDDSSGRVAGPTEHNRAIEAARRAALGWQPDSLLVVSADLPWLRSDEVRELIALGDTAPGVVIAPDRRGQGTNALFLHPPDAIAFHFGEDSYARHRRAAEAAGLPVRIYNAPGTAFDVDLPEDLAAWKRATEATNWGAAV